MQRPSHPPADDALSQNVRPIRVPRRPPRPLTPEAYVEGILQADRVVLGRAITLVESTLPAHQELAEQIVERCLPHAGRSIRVGITGVPGVGKSTFIEALGVRLIEQGRRGAVLAIDPSSARTGGSILGDKTRMERLSSQPDAFIRPSPSAGSLGGVARRTRETIFLCEAAGFDTILVETVGVGQSEITVHAMVDFFLLLALAGAGDELQGIKRGIMEMADAIAINKADGDNFTAAQRARVQYRNALHLFPLAATGWAPPVLTCSAATGDGLDRVWQAVLDYAAHTQENGSFDRRRREQARHWLRETIEMQLREQFYADESVRAVLPLLEADVVEGRTSSTAAARALLRRHGGAASRDGLEHQP